MSAVRDFERAFAEYVGAGYAIALCNGTATLHTALVALGVKPGDGVAVPPLTMASTTIAVLHAGGIPCFVDVDPHAWLMAAEHGIRRAIPVSLYGLHSDYKKVYADSVDDAAQTLRPHDGVAHDFTSYSFQASKILALGEGGMLCTNDEELATRAREFSSLGYRMRADQPRIDPAALKHPTYARHHSPGMNYRMSELVARQGHDAVRSPVGMAWLKAQRASAAALYRDAVIGCPWITPQHVPEGWTHDYWTYAVALESAGLWEPFVAAIERHGGERPYAAWRVTYQEPAFRHLAEDGTCPVAEDLQPRLVQFQTNSIESARVNAEAVAAAIREIGG